MKMRAFPGACLGKAPWRGRVGAGDLPGGEFLSGGCLYLSEGSLSCQGSRPCVRGGRMTAPSVCSSPSVPGAAQSESGGSGSGVKGERGSPRSVNLRPDTRSKVWQPGKTERGCCHSGHAPSTPLSIHLSIHPSLPPPFSPHSPRWDLAAGGWVDAWADRQTDEWVCGAFPMS